MSEQFLDGRVVLYCGDCRDVMATLAENSVDAVVTDPPYGIGFMGKEWDSGKAFVERKQAKANKFDHVGGNHNPIDSVDAARTRRVEGRKFGAWCEVWASECLRVLKPGAHLLAFGGDRTFHRLACAIEDAGFEIRGTIVYAFGSGFPKSLNVSKRMRGYFSADALRACDHCDWQTIRDCPSDCLSDHDHDGAPPRLVEDSDRGGFPLRGDARVHNHGDQRLDDPEQGQANIFLGEESGHLSSEDSAYRRPMLDNCQFDDSAQCDIPLNTSNDEEMVARKTRARKSGTPHLGDDWVSSARYVNLSRCAKCGKRGIPNGLGTSLKPAVELLCLARKPLSEGTIVANVLKWGCGALNIDVTRIPVDATGQRPCFAGRFPANLIHDGSPEVVAAFPEAPGQQQSVGPQHGKKSSVNVYGDYGPRDQFEPRGDSGSAARFFKSCNGRDGEASAERRYADHNGDFAMLPGQRRDATESRRLFYTAKADDDDRLGSKHPTVKPLDLMQYLVRLVTPNGGLVLDPFAGTGTTGDAAFREGMRAVLIEREPAYCVDIRRRMALVLAGPDERFRESIKANGRAQGHDDLPLFQRT